MDLLTTTLTSAVLGSLVTFVFVSTAYNSRHNKDRQKIRDLNEKISKYMDSDLEVTNNEHDHEIILRMNESTFNNMMAGLTDAKPHNNPHHFQ